MPKTAPLLVRLCFTKMLHKYVLKYLLEVSSKHRPCVMLNNEIKHKIIIEHVLKYSS